MGNAASTINNAASRAYQYTTSFVNQPPVVEEPTQPPIIEEPTQPPIIEKPIQPPIIEEPIQPIQLPIVQRKEVLIRQPEVVEFKHQIIQVADFFIPNKLIPCVLPANWFYCDGRYAIGFSDGYTNLNLTALDFFTNTFNRVRIPSKLKNGEVFPLNCDEYQVFAMPLNEDDYLVILCYTVDISEIFVSTCTVSFDHGNARGRLHKETSLGSNFDTGVDPEFYFEPTTSNLLFVRHELNFTFTMFIYHVSVDELVLRNVLSALPNLNSEFLCLSPEKTIVYFVPSDEEPVMGKLEILNLGERTRSQLQVEPAPELLNEAIENRLYTATWHGNIFYILVPIDGEGKVSLFMLDLKTRKWARILLPRTLDLHPDTQDNGCLQMFIDEEDVITVRWHTRIPSREAMSRHAVYRIPLREPATLFCSAYFECKKHGMPSTLPYTFPIVPSLSPPPYQEKPSRKRRANC